MKLRLNGLSQLRNDLAGLANRLRDLGPAYLRAGTVVLASAQMRIRSKNDGQWPSQATGKDGSGNTQGTLLFRTGALMRSLTIGESGNMFQDLGNGVRVGTNLMTPDGTYSIGRLMQYGTGPITPKNGKFLVFEVNGQKIFSKGTKGIPARPFLFIDDEDAQRVRDVFASHIVKGES